MTRKRSESKAKSATEGKSRRLKIKKETLKDLDVKEGKGVRGGGLSATQVVCSVGCAMK